MSSTVSSPVRRLLKVPEVAEALGIGQTRVWYLIGRGEIGSVRIGRSRRVPISALDAYIEKLDQEADKVGSHDT